VQLRHSLKTIADALFWSQLNEADNLYIIGSSFIPFLKNVSHEKQVSCLSALKKINILTGTA
jgi:hypothetical protein